MLQRIISSLMNSYGSMKSQRAITKSNKIFKGLNKIKYSSSIKLDRYLRRKLKSLRVNSDILMYQSQTYTKMSKDEYVLDGVNGKRYSEKDIIDIIRYNLVNYESMPTFTIPSGRRPITYAEKNLLEDENLYTFGLLYIDLYPERALVNGFTSYESINHYMSYIRFDSGSYIFTSNDGKKELYDTNMRYIKYKII